MWLLKRGNNTVDRCSALLEIYNCLCVCVLREGIRDGETEMEEEARLDNE